MGQIDIKLSNFVKKLFDLPHKLFSFPYRNKVSESGIIYVNQFLRSTTILLDLTLIIFALQFLFYIFSIFYSFPIEIAEKYKLGMEITIQDKEALMGYYKVVFIMQIIQFIIIMLYVIFMWHKFGGTPAKLLFKVRILDEHTLEKPSISQCIKRFFMFPISVLCLFLGMIWPLFDKKARTWHDIVAGTVVVMKKSLKN
jgi:uncharacterized RDD family membrane protein YckC